jgi:carboxypeptidase D
MRSCYALLTAVLAGAAVARIRPIGPAGGLPTLRPPFRESLRESRAESAPSQASQGKRVQSDFLVKSSALPLVTFQLQNSYAGRLPISAHINETRVSSLWIQQVYHDNLTLWI